LVAAALYWSVTRHRDPDSGGGGRVELNVSRLGNSPAPTNFDTGQQATVSSDPGDPGATPTVRDGTLTFAPTKSTAAAAFYASPDMDGSINGIGAQFVFESRAGTPGGTISLVVCHGTQAFPPAITPPAPVQLVVTPVSWSLSLKKDNSKEPEPIAVGNFSPPLTTDGSTTYDVSVQIDGSVVTTKLPDGSQKVVNDARIDQWKGSYALFGLYSLNPQTDSLGGFKKLWATSRKGDR
jgi:hypothetical protein